jgi:hypothetical protein
VGTSISKGELRKIMLHRYGFPVLLAVLIPVFGQTPTTLDLSTQSRNVDFSNFRFTRPLTTGSSLPPTCQIGQLFFNTAVAAGTNVFSCTAQDTWTAVGSGSNYTLPQATATTLGGVTISSNSGLNISSGGLSVNYGVGQNTTAQGNDSRIIGALQIAKNLSDLANVTAALANLKLTGASPLSISASTTGNAATATQLRVLPAGCAPGQYATGVGASGNASCAQIQSSDVSGLAAALSQMNSSIANLQATVQSLASVPTFVDFETPVGTVDGANATFVLNAAPSPPASLVLHRNGMTLSPGADYSLSGKSISFSQAAVPQSGDLLSATYRR